VTTAAGRFVLTLFESIEPAALDFYLALQDRLARAGLPCPQPLADSQGQRWRGLAGKPAALLTCLPGAPWRCPPRNMPRRREHARPSASGGG
jgi:homoserine kinase type II